LQKTVHVAVVLLAFRLCACHFDWSDVRPEDYRADAHVPIERSEDGTSGLPPSATGAVASEPSPRCEIAADCGDGLQFQCRDNACRRSPECSGERQCAEGYSCEDERCVSKCQQKRCDVHATCALAKGDAVCSCDADYAQSDARSCESDAACARLGCAADALCQRAADARSCACKPGFMGDGKHCERSSCGALEVPEHGRVVQTGMRFSDTARVLCEPGFVAVGSMLRVCQADGSWSAGAGSCEPANCGALAAPMHGAVNTPDGTAAGQRAAYSCDEGYALMGEGARECQADGSWSAAAASCSPVSCGSLSAPEHGSVMLSGTDFPARASFGCDPGYERKGTAERECQADGSWSAGTFSCEPRNCGPLTDPRNGSVALSGTSFGQAASYSCKAGFVLIGSETRSCREDGKWSAAAPSCECSRDLQSDAQNCGACGTRCASGACVAGECARRVFVTSERHAPSFGSLAQADAVCQRAATQAMLQGNFMAWLSDDSSSPAMRFVHGKGQYQRVDGVVIANDFTDLIDGRLLQPLNVTEQGQSADGRVNTYVYTSTQADGSLVRVPALEPSAALGATCQSWKIASERAWGAYGSFDTTAATWSYGGSRTPCVAELPIYCFEQ
jgi:hypothetical protein